MLEVGLNVTEWSIPSIEYNRQLALAAESYGFAAIWTSETTGSDAVTPLAWLAAQTSKIALGTAVLPIAARSPVATAMTARSLDMLSQGRFRLGLGLSGRSETEAWHGATFDSPLEREREYIDVVRLALSGEPLVYDGRHFRLGPRAATSPDRLETASREAYVPIFLGANGSKHVELAARCADGWLPLFVNPDKLDRRFDRVQAGLADRRGALEQFAINPIVPAAVGHDVSRLREGLRSYPARFICGFGPPHRNPYSAIFSDHGFKTEVERCFSEACAGHLGRAIRAIPDELVDGFSLVGSPERMAAKLLAYLNAGFTSLTVYFVGSSIDDQLEGIRDIAKARDLAWRRFRCSGGSCGAWGSAH